MKAADELAKHVGVKPACAALEVSRSTLYRRRGPSTGQQQPRPTPARALSETERGEVFDTLCSERFVDRSPAEVVATLLDEEVYLCSERTMYRVLASEVPVQRVLPRRLTSDSRNRHFGDAVLALVFPSRVWVFGRGSSPFARGGRLYGLHGVMQEGDIRASCSPENGSCILIQEGDIRA